MTRSVFVTGGNRGIGHAVAAAFARAGDRVVVAPGYVDTDMTGALSERVRADTLGQIPMRRVARPEEIAAAVRFLASPDAGYITGAVLPVDGGLGMGH